MSAATCSTSSKRSRSYRLCVNPSPVRAIAASASLHRARSRALAVTACTLRRRSHVSPTPHRSRDGVEHGPLDLARGGADRSTRPPVARAHVERVDDLHADRLHGGVADVEAELGERLGDAVQDADLGRSPAPRSRSRCSTPRRGTPPAAGRAGRPASAGDAGTCVARSASRASIASSPPSARPRSAFTAPTRCPPCRSSTRNCDAAMPAARRSAPAR